MHRLRLITLDLRKTGTGFMDIIYFPSYPGYTKKEKTSIIATTTLLNTFFSAGERSERAKRASESGWIPASPAWISSLQRPKP